MSKETDRQGEIKELRRSLELPDVSSFEGLEEEFKKWLIIDDPDVLKIIFATVIANRMTGDPLWIFLIAPPGGCKTEILRSLNSHETLSVSTLTEHSLISGLRQGKNSQDPSLLPKLDGKVLIIKDFTSILTMRRESREEIIGTLRDAYDGECSKAFGSMVGTIRYKSKFGIIAAVTPIIDKYYSIEQQLGERFLKVRMKHLNPDNLIEKAHANIGRETSMREELHSAVSSLLLKIPPSTGIDFKCSIEIQKQLCSLANLLAVLRSDVPRNPYDDSIEYIPEPEIGTRLVKQLTKISIGLALLAKRDEIKSEDYQIAKRIALDTLPSKKKAVIDSLIMLRYSNGDSMFPTQEIANKCAIPTETCKFILEDLRIMNVVIRDGTNRYVWCLKENIWNALEICQI